MPGLSSPIFTGMAHRDATITLDIGPANDTIAMPERIRLPNRAGLTGVGLPQPNPTTTIMTVPAGSRWAKGIQCQSTLALCGVVSEQVCAQGVAELVEGDRCNDGERESQECEDGIRRLGA